MIRDIVLAPDPILREKAAVIDPKGLEVLEVLDDLDDTFDAAEGQLVGLAANQIGWSLAAMLVDVPDGRTRWHMLNPKIIRKSTIKLGHFEQCASLPDLEVYVVRPSSVMVAWDCPFKKKSRVYTFMDYEARIVQHEIDHLNGVLLTDYEQETS